MSALDSDSRTSKAADNPVRFIYAFVSSLDLAGLGFNRAQPAKTGRPACDPGDLLRHLLCRVVLFFP